MTFDHVRATFLLKRNDCKDGLVIFEQKAKRVKRSRMDTSGVVLQRNRAFVQAFFHVSLPIAKAQMPHTIAQESILPCVKEINCILSGKETESKLNVLLFSDNAGHSRISLMSDHIKDQVIDQTKSAGPFILQLD